MKKLSVMMVLVVLAVTLVTSYSFASQQSVKIMIDGQELRIPVGEPKAYVDKNNRTVIPIKFIAEALGLEVDWNRSQQLVTFTDADTTVKLKIGERQATVNGKTVYFDTQAVITQARTFVPLKFVSESFGAKVEWISRTRTVVIT
ncbi:copper amine oxidase N-terminal domain-containing protein, partial [Heliorestis acidaminivorans]